MTEDINIIQLDDADKKRIAVCCLPGLEGFLGDIVSHLEENYSVRTCYSQHLKEHEKVISWCDLVWIEWANQLAVELSQKLPILAEKKVILRIHSYEVLNGFLQHIVWDKISDVIFVASHVKDVAVKQLPGLLNPDMNPPDMFVIPNGVEVK